MLVFRKILRTHQMDDPVVEIQFQLGGCSWILRKKGW